MSKLIAIICLIICILTPVEILCENQDSLFNINKAKTLLRKAGVLFNNELYSQALDTLSASLEYRKKNYGEISPELIQIYGLLGVTSRRLGRLNQTLKY